MIGLSPIDRAQNDLRILKRIQNFEAHQQRLIREREERATLRC